MASTDDLDVRQTGFVTGGPGVILRLEAAAALAAILGLYQAMGLNWTLFAVLFLAPDLAMVGYLGGRRLGALAYNSAHSWIGPIALAAAAQVFPVLLPYALIWGAHVGFDRALGFGLKYASAFGDTHLGLGGKRRAAAAA
jgi:hypothetical protein